MAFVKSYLIQVLTGWLLAAFPKSKQTVQRGNNGHVGNGKHPAKVYVCVTH